MEESIPTGPPAGVGWALSAIGARNKIEDLYLHVKTSLTTWFNTSIVHPQHIRRIRRIEHGKTSKSDTDERMNSIG